MLLTRTFVMLPEFDKQWANLGLTDKDLNRLQLELLENPQKGEKAAAQELPMLILLSMRKST